MKGLYNIDKYKTYFERLTLFEFHDLFLIF